MKEFAPTRDRLDDIVQWDVRTWSRALDFWDRNVDWSRVHTCLELGGREGGLSLWLALKNKVVVCSDLSNTETTARPLHERYGAVRLVLYEDIDATDLPYENHFDLVVFKSILGGIGRKDDKVKQRQVFERILKALVPGGCLLFAENMAASVLHRSARKRFSPWSAYWRYPSYDEMQEFLSGFTAYDMRTTGFTATFGRNETQRDILARLDAVLDKAIGNRWKYMAYGIAIK
jgi:SAM-dependent methyltransferase